ncbi:MAG: hypothetical protein QOE54_2487 [Streptosporangiaceae bacterium]|jgi:hypothetical protein|nr:hypothetical protein [Streptosporangiaceae bacterium]MDX6430121.1 hypothetical protein [Streptosporangiaceae bacterium]
MGLGTGLAFIAIGAILAFATHFTLNGIDVQTIGWILMLVGIASIAFTLMYVRPRRRGLVTDVVGEEPVVDVHPDDPVPPHVHVDQPVQQTVQPGQPVQPVQPGQATVRPGQPAPHVRSRGPQDLQP